MLKTLIEDEKGNVWLNSLRRTVLSGVVVPSAANTVVKIPAALSASSPGISAPIPLEGPQDARSQLYSFTGVQGLKKLGTGTISSAVLAITGVGTKFLTELLPGDNIIVNGQTQVVATVIDNLNATTVVAFAPALAAVPFAFQTPALATVIDQLTVMIQDVAWRRPLMNVPVPVEHVFGDARKPLRLRETILLERNQTLLFNFFNNTTAAAGSIGFSSEARKWQAEAFKRKGVAAFIAGLRRRKLYCQPYWLTLNAPTSVGAGSVATQFMTVSDDIFLFLFNMYGNCFTTGVAGDTQEVMQYEMFDAKTERAYQNQPWTLNTGMGTAQNPFVLPAPIVIDREGQVKISFKNLITDQPTQAFVTLHGVAVYKGTSGLTDPALMKEAKRIYNATVPTLVPGSRPGVF